jgi:hypothetical protein
MMKDSIFVIIALIFIRLDETETASLLRSSVEVMLSLAVQTQAKQ